MSFSLPADVGSHVREETERWTANQMVGRIWARDATVWTNSGESDWLGWLDIVKEELGRVDLYTALTRDIENAGFADILLMGMGGSSLCPEVLALTFSKPHFHILDSTVPSQVKVVEEKLDLERTLFIVASKSGSTLEPNCFKQYFYDRLVSIVGAERAGRQFIAITDPGSKLEQIARDEGFRHVFYGRPDVGGRFSALSAFGMTAAASMGMDVEAFLRSAGEMSDACQHNDPSANPGAALGIVLGTCQKLGRDKLTIFASPEIADLGAWLEQLIAESTGKNGVAIIPVDREPAIDTARYSDDRVFVFIGTDDGFDEERFAAVTELGHPAIRVMLDGIGSLGQEFYRWEFATAVCGAVMGINPFDQPDVEAAKIEARKITEEYEQTGTLPEVRPFFSDDGFSLFTGSSYANVLSGSADEMSVAALLRAHIDQVASGDYFALLAYIKMDEANEDLLTSIRDTVLRRNGNATCLGFGPRFLHSTGQAYKGGPNNGVFLQITADDEIDLPVPGQQFSFGTVKTAQARGDFQVLVDRDRRALNLHISGDILTGLEKIREIFA